MGLRRQADARTRGCVVAVVAVVVALGLSLFALFAPAFAGAALASDWTEIPFPPGETVWDLAQDSDGNVWVTTHEQSRDFGHIELLMKGASQWEDACLPGLDWSSFQWSDGLEAVGNKVFLVVTDGSCYTRSAADVGWRRVQASQAFYDLAEWDGYLWAGGGPQGVIRMDPTSEAVTTMNGGLPVAGGNPLETRGFWAPRGNSKYLYVGFTVDSSTAADPAFKGVGVYRLARGGSSWEDTGLKVMPFGTDLNRSQATANNKWGVWAVSAVDGYVLAEVSAPSDALTSRLFLFDEATSTWSSVALPSDKPGWYYSDSEAACVAWKGQFYFSAATTSDEASFDVFDPASKTWRTGVAVSGTGWAPLGNAAQPLGTELLLHTGQTTKAAQPTFVESVPLPTQISTDPGVIGTNFGLALLFAMVFGFTSTLFNSTLKSNSERISRALAPMRNALGRDAGGRHPAVRRLENWVVAFAFRSSVVRRLALRAPHLSRRWLERLAIVLLAALVYAFLDPKFGFSQHGVNIYFSLFVSVAAVTVAWEGVQALTSARGYRIPAAVKLFPAAIAIAVLCVLLSRLSGFSPGYLYGFVGGLAFLGSHPEERKRGRLVLVGGVCLLAVSVAAWFLAMPLSKVAGGPWWAAFLQSVCVATFVAGLEGLLFGLVPLSFMEGGPLFHWNKVIWSALFGVALFLFWHVLLNKNSKYGAAFEQTNTQVVLALLGFWTVITVGTYLLFRRARRREPVLAPWPYPHAPAPPPYPHAQVPSPHQQAPVPAPPPPPPPWPGRPR